MINDFEKNKIYEFNVIGEIIDKKSNESYDVIILGNKKFVELGNEIFLDYEYLDKNKIEYYEVIK